MKQTNNAIKFLMAQYRAIFQNAYFKGLATAAVVTMGLAVGQAQADITNATGWQGLSGAQTEKINITGDISADDGKNNNEFTLILNQKGNIINPAKGTNKTATLAAENGTIQVNGAQADLTIGATADDNGTTVSIKTLDIQKGTVTVTNTAQKTNSVSLSDKLILGNGGKLVVSGSDTKVTVGTAKETTINLGSGGIIELQSGAVAGKQLVGTGGKIDVKVGGDWTVGNYFEKETATPNLQNISVKAGETLTVKLAGKDAVATVSPDQRGVLHFASGSTIDLVSKADSSTTLAISDDGSKFGSIVILDKGVKLTSSDSQNSGGIVSISGSGAGVGLSELHIDADVLDSFLKADSDVAGAVILDANSKLQVNNKTVKFGTALASDDSSVTLAVASGDAYDAGKVLVKGATTISAQDMVVEGKLGEKLNANLTLAADNLTLGKSGVNMSSDGTGVAALQAKNVQFIGENNDTAFVLNDVLTLKNVKNIGTAAVPKYQAQVGTVTGDFDISGDGKSLTVDGGIYTLSNNVKLLDSGSLTVSNTLEADKSLLKFDTGSKLDLTAASKSSITVESGAELDISNATLALTTSDQSDEVLKVNVTSGTFTTSGKNLTELLTKDDASHTSGSQIVLDNGTIKVTDSVTLDKGFLKAADDADAGFQIAIHTTNGGTLDVAEKLTLTGLSDTAFALKDTANIKATELELQVGSDKTKTANIGSGNYTVFETLASDSTSDAGVTLAASATLNLGEIATNADGDKVAKGPEAGQITTQLTTNSGQIAVNAGSWTTTKGIKVGGAADGLVVGNDGTTLDANDNKISSSLTVQGKLDSAIASGVKVQKTGTLKTAEIASIAGGIEVSGALVVDGKITKNANDATQIDSYGVNLSGVKAIDVKEDASLSFGEAATQAIKLVDGQTAGVISSVANQDGITSYTEGALKSEIGSTVSLAFADTVKFDADGLDSLRKLLFGADHATNLGGFLNIGNASIAGLDNVGETIKWSELSKYDDITSNVTNEKLQQAVVTEITSTDEIRGNVGALSSKDLTADQQIIIKDQTTLNNAAGNDNKFASGKDGVAVGLDVKHGQLTLNNGGEAGKVTLAAGSKLAVNGNGKDTTLASIAGEDAQTKLTSGNLILKQASKLGDVETAKDTSLVVQSGDLSIKSTDSTLNGDLTITKGNLTLSGDISLNGNTTVTGNLASTGVVSFEKAVTKVTGDASINKSKISNGAQLIVDGKLSLSKDADLLLVGSYDEDNNSAGYLQANKVVLSKGTLMLDPDYNSPSSVAVITKFEDHATSGQFSGDAGYADGNLIVGQNSALFVGVDTKEEGLTAAKSFLSQYQKANGALDVENKGYGAIAYVNDKVAISKSGFLLVDTKATSDKLLNDDGDIIQSEFADYKKAVGTVTPNAYLGKNTALVISDNILEDGAAVHFDTTNAAIHVADSSARVLLDGNGFTNGNREFTLFTDNGTATTPGQNADTNGVLIVGNDLRVETVNGLMFLTYEAGQETTAKELQLDTERAKTIFSDASAPMKNFLVGFAAQDKNWQALGTDVYKKDLVVGAQGPDAKYFTIDASGKITGIDNSVTGNPVAANEVSKYVAVQTGTDATSGKPVYTVYEKTSNQFLEKITGAQSSGVAADQAARMGDFGGAAETALVATSTTYDAVAGRFGMGQQAGTMTIANNGQGSGLWVTPVYKSHESDGFDADGLGYGSDITLYGVALGGDVTLANGVRVGAMFNVGSGDADGQGAASVVSNDFDYFGGSIYAGYAIDNLSIVGDISYTTIDSDVEANTAAGKTSTSFDTTALSVGVTGQYSLKVAEMDVTPHAGMRFTRIDMDDYTIDSADFGEVGQYNASSANVFSIPVGVTISKEYVTDTWTVKPSFDLTLTGNFGDDTVDGTVSWSGVSNWDVSTKAEFVDNFTYGASVGIAAKTGNFGLGLGLNYTGSSNTDEFGVNANARYMF